MADKIQKFLASLGRKDYELLVGMIELLTLGKSAGTDTKKLKGSSDIFRVRKGAFRIIYKRAAGKEFKILDVGRRGDNTYNKF